MQYLLTIKKKDHKPRKIKLKLEKKILVNVNVSSRFYGSSFKKQLVSYYIHFYKHIACNSKFLFFFFFLNFFPSFVFISKEKLVLLSVEEKMCKRKLSKTLYKSITLTVFSYILMRKQKLFAFTTRLILISILTCSPSNVCVCKFLLFLRGKQKNETIK